MRKTTILLLITSALFACGKDCWDCTRTWTYSTYYLDPNDSIETHHVDVAPQKQNTVETFEECSLKPGDTKPGYSNEACCVMNGRQYYTEGWSETICAKK